MTKAARRIDRLFDRIARKVPSTKGFLDWLRKPSARIVRLPLSILLILGGIFSILPFLGIWMLPLGLLLLAIDIAFLQAPVGGTIIGWQRKVTMWWRSRRKPL